MITKISPLATCVPVWGLRGTAVACRGASVGRRLRVQARGLRLEAQQKTKGGSGASNSKKGPSLWRLWPAEGASLP